MAEERRTWERTHDMSVEMHTHHAVHDLVQFRHHWFSDLWDRICSNPGLR